MSNKTKYRILEIIPGTTLWLTFILAIVLSFIKPLWVIYFIILYDLYWFIRIIYFVTYLFISWKRYHDVNKINWFNEIKKIGGYEKYYHLIVLPTYKEGMKVFRDTLNGLVAADYDSKKFIIILSRELRAGEDYTKKFLADAEILHREFDDKFYKFFTIIHPVPPKEELPGKGSNATWAVKKIKEEFIDPEHIPYEDIIVSNFDSDTAVYPQYFSRLVYLWMTADNPHRHSYQPLTLYNNNIWDAPSFARVVANSTTFWLMAEKARPERLFTFSSHSMSFKTLVEVNYWETDIVTEDSRIFLQCFDHFNGEYSTIPMYIPISMDTVMGKNLWGTIQGQYKQMRRWAWSVEHFPWMTMHFSRNKKIPWGKKLKYLINQSEGQYSWATGPIFITLLGRLPLYIASREHLSFAIIQNAPFILEVLMALAMLGVVVAGFINIFFLPGRPAKYKKIKWLAMALQWLLLPITMIFFGSVPALDAQTRLMLGGKYRLGFDVTEKHRK
ncbi:MAG: glycosyltransferase family 2 protein [Patescibacteria group bacterium]|nr:glycosyltransferase family 2 protein [Patescibacteria group bacterium]